MAHKETFTLNMICQFCQRRVRKHLSFVVCPHQDLKGYTLSHGDCWFAHRVPVREMTEGECDHA